MIKLEQNEPLLGLKETLLEHEFQFHVPIQLPGIEFPFQYQATVTNSSSGATQHWVLWVAKSATWCPIGFICSILNRTTTQAQMPLAATYHAFCQTLTSKEWTN